MNFTTSPKCLYCIIYQFYFFIYISKCNYECNYFVKKFVLYDIVSVFFFYFFSYAFVNVLFFYLFFLFIYLFFYLSIFFQFSFCLFSSVCFISLFLHIPEGTKGNKIFESLNL